MRLVLMITLFVIINGTGVFAQNNTTMATAEEIAVNSVITEQLGSNYAWYQTTLAETGTFAVRLGCDADHATTYGYWKVSIYVDNKFIMEDVTFKADGKTYSSPLYGYPKGTKVYIRIGGYNVEQKPYNLCIENQKNSNWETENNNLINDADKIKANNYYCGNLPLNDDADYFYTAMPKTGYAQVYLGRRDFDKDSFYGGWKLSVIVDNKVILDKVYISQDITSEYVSPKFGYKKGQKIYVKIEDSNSDNFIYYKMKIKTVGSKYWETENNNSKSKADTITLNNKYNGVLVNANDMDWYKYKVKKTGKIKFYAGEQSIDNLGKHYYTVYVGGKKVLNQAVNDETLKKLGTLKVKKGQTVYIKVENPYYSYYSTAYTIKLKQ